MNTITKNSDFVGRYAIAGAEDNEPNSEGNNQQLQLFIEEFEPKCLVTTLGYSLYDELKPELLKKPFVPEAAETADEKWIDLVNGKDNYQGLKILLVPYIYFYFLESDDEHHSMVGVKRETPKGATRTPATKKAVIAWRAFYKNTVGQSVSNNVFAMNTIRGSVVGVIHTNTDDKFWSLYNFLNKNKDIYTNWSPSKIIKHKSIWNLVY